MSSETPASPPEKQKRLTEAEWAEAKALYETGRLSKTMLADKYGISRQSMGEGLNARGAVYGSKSKEIEQATVEAQKDASLRKAEEIDAMKEKQKKFVEMIQNLTVKAITDKAREGKPLADAKNDIVALRNAMMIVAQGRDELYHLYDLHREPDGAQQTEEFIVSEYTSEEIEILNKVRLGISADADNDLREIEASLQDQDTELDDLLGGSPLQ